MVVAMKESQGIIDEYAKEMTSRFEKFINSEPARHTLDAIEEGESITIENTEIILKVQKKNGRAVVDFIGYTHDKGKT